MGQILYHTALLAPSLQDTDPWSITLEVNPGSEMMDLGSVGPGYRSKPWCTGKQLPLGFNPTGPVQNDSKVELQASSGKRQALDRCQAV